MAFLATLCNYSYPHLIDLQSVLEILSEPYVIVFYVTFDHQDVSTIFESARQGS